MGIINRFLKDTLIYGIAAVLPRAVNVFLVKLHTSSLGVDKYAINTDYYVYAAYLNALLTYGMETAFFRFFSGEKKKGKVISTSFITLLVTSLMFLTTGLFFSETLAIYFGFKDPVFLKLLIWTITLDTLVVIPYAYLRVTHEPKRFTLFKVINIAVFAILNVFFLWAIPYGIQNNISFPEFLIDYYHSHPKVLYIFVSGTIASAVTFLCLLPVIFKFKFGFDILLLKKMLSYGLPVMVGSLAFVTNENLDKLLLGNMLGDATMGAYAACYKLGVFMTLYIMAFRLGAEPFFFNTAAKKNAKETYSKILIWFSLIGAFCMLVIVVFIDFFAHILLGKPEYFAALQIVPIILLANLFLGIYNNLSIWYKLTNKTVFGMFFSVLGAVITIGFNMMMIPKIGFMASAWATLITYGTMMVLSYCFGRKHYPVNYQLKKMGFYMAITIIFCTVSFLYFRENYVVSIAAVLLFLLMVFTFEKKEILNTIRHK
ncbi:MAG: oligosaccharide flippase family protein [Flavobacteriaceae bacterium]|nr:MAG: oligosaccharide flippase family protein [Flavobacteriaceae bacterium]